MSANHDLYLDLVRGAGGRLDRARGPPRARGAPGPDCAECLAFLRDLSTPIEALARSVPAAKPSRGLKARVMVAISQGRGPGGGPAAPTAGRGRRARPRAPRVGVGRDRGARPRGGVRVVAREHDADAREARAGRTARVRRERSDATRYDQFVAGAPTRSE